MSKARSSPEALRGWLVLLYCLKKKSKSQRDVFPVEYNTNSSKKKVRGKGPEHTYDQPMSKHWPPSYNPKEVNSSNNRGAWGGVLGHRQKANWFQSHEPVKIQLGWTQMRDPSTPGDKFGFCDVATLGAIGSAAMNNKPTVYKEHFCFLWFRLKESNQMTTF